MSSTSPAASCLHSRGKNDCSSPTNEGSFVSILLLVAKTAMGDPPSDTISASRLIQILHASVFRVLDEHGSF